MCVLMVAVLVVVVVRVVASMLLSCCVGAAWRAQQQGQCRVWELAQILLEREAWEVGEISGHHRAVHCEQ